MSDQKAPLPSRFAKMLIGKKKNPATPSSNSPISQAPSSERGDIFTSAIEITFIPIILFGIGFFVDHELHTLPIFSIFGLLFGSIGVILRIYYGLTGITPNQIGLKRPSSASIVSRFDSDSSTLDLSRRSLLSADLTLSDDVLDAAKVFDGGVDLSKTNSDGTSK